MKKTFLFVIFILFTSTFSFAEDITSTRAVREFFKEHTKFRISSDSIKAYKAALNQMSLKVIQQAADLVKENNRKTVLERDIEQATEETFRRAPMSAKELMGKIKLLSIIELADLNKKIKAYGEKLLESAKEKN